MAEFFFYGTNVDAVRVLKSLIAMGGVSVIPDKLYEGPPVEEYDTLEDHVLPELLRAPRLYVRGGFGSAPLRLRQLDAGPAAGKWHIPFEVADNLGSEFGGPVLSLSVPGCNERSGCLYLYPGDFYRPRRYWDKRARADCPVPEDIKQAYEAMVRRIKAVLSRKKIGRHTEWIGADAYEKLVDGKALILINGYWLKRDGTVVKSNRPGERGF
jgi:hypothetical protein